MFCVYPISGTYTSLQRNLFYITTALALLGHAHEWLTAACLAFTVSYSSTAAIHGLALALFQGDSPLHHDSDFLAVGAIVSWALYASIVCALFCPQLLGRNLYVLVRAWCALLAAAHLALVLSSPRLVRDIAASLVLSRRDKDGQWSDPCAGMEVRTVFRGYPGDSMSAVVLDSVRVNHASLPQSPPGADADIIPRQETVRAADVILLIVVGSLKNSFMLAPSFQTLAADRRVSRNDVFVRMLAKRVPYLPSRSKGSKLFPAIVTVRFLQLYWFLGECIPFLLVVDFRIRLAVRMVLRLFGIRKLRIEDMSFLEPDLSQRRYQAAKYAALSFYILTTLGYVTWVPVVAPFAMGGATGFLARIPESETFRAVGQWSPWLTLFLAIATALVNRLLVSYQSETMDSWVKQHRFNLLYTQVRDWLVVEWRETKEWWSNPEEQAIASLRAVEQDDDTEHRFTNRMIRALEEFSTDWAGFLLPPPRPSQPDEQLRAQDCLPVHNINRAGLISTRSTARKGKSKERLA